MRLGAHGILEETHCSAESSSSTMPVGGQRMRTETDHCAVSSTSECSVKCAPSGGQHIRAESDHVSETSVKSDMRSAGVRFATVRNEGAGGECVWIDTCEDSRDVEESIQVLDTGTTVQNALTIAGEPSIFVACEAECSPLTTKTTRMTTKSTVAGTAMGHANVDTAWTAKNDGYSGSAGLRVDFFSKRQQEQVILHVYDLCVSGGRINLSVNALNAVLNPLGTGAYHVAIEVYGDEWTYGHVPGDETGVIHFEPRCCPDHRYRQAVPLGPTSVTAPEFRQMICKLETEWLGNQYDLLRHNCVKFCMELSRLLGVSELPSWVQNLGDTGEALRGIKNSFLALPGNALPSFLTSPRSGGSRDTSPAPRVRSSPAEVQTPPRQLSSERNAGGNPAVQGRNSTDSVELCSGWLAKRGPMFGWKWQQRWCVLSPASLVWWEDGKCRIKRGDIQLKQSSFARCFRDPDSTGEALKHRDDRPYGFVLDVDPDGGRSRKFYYFDALDAESLEKWTGCLAERSVPKLQRSKRHLQTKDFKVA